MDGHEYLGQRVGTGWNAEVETETQRTQPVCGEVRSHAPFLTLRAATVLLAKARVVDMSVTELLGLHSLETDLAILCTAILAVAVIRGAPRGTLVLLSGCLLITSSAILRYLLPFELGEHAKIAGWLLVAIYCMTLLRTRTTNGDGASATLPVPLRSNISTTAMLGLGVGIAANGFAIYTILTLLSVPRGAEIRPMGHTMVLWQLALGSLLLGVPLSAIGCFQSRGWRRIWGILGILLNLAVLPVGVVLLRVVTYVAGFTLES
jgi:hypothetical protein